MLAQAPAPNDTPHAVLPVQHFIKGRQTGGTECIHRSRDMGCEFATPAIDPDALVWQRRDPLPMLDVPLEEIVSFLVELGKQLNFDTNDLLRESFAGMCRVSALGPRILENCYRDMAFMFERDVPGSPN